VRLFELPVKAEKIYRLLKANGPNS